MLFRLFLLFTLVPMVELLILIRIAREIGFWPTVAIVLLTGIAGAYLARREGIRALYELRSSMARGEMPGNALLNGFDDGFGYQFQQVHGVQSHFYYSVTSLNQQLSPTRFNVFPFPNPQFIRGYGSILNCHLILTP